MTTLKRGNNQSLVLDQRIGAGGEAAIYAVSGKPNIVAKIYHHPTGLHAAKLQAMVVNPPANPTQHLGHISIAWPTELIFGPHGDVVGFLMPRIDYTRGVPLLELYNPQDRHRRAPRFTWEYLLHTARNLASALEAVHAGGYVVGDLNESNLLVTDTALVSVVDCDSMQVPASNGQVFRCPVGKPEYTPPELQGCDFSSVDRCPSHDNFGLAVLIFLLLMEGVHPFSGVWQGAGTPPTSEENIRAGECPYANGRRITPPPYALPFSTLPPTIQGLMVQCFDAGHKNPSARPTPSQWRHALEQAERSLTHCSSNKQHVYSQHLSQCPWCVRIQQGIPDPFPQPGQQTALPPISFAQPLQTHANANLVAQAFAASSPSSTATPLGFPTSSSSPPTPTTNPPSTRLPSSPPVLQSLVDLLRSSRLAQASLVLVALVAVLALAVLRGSPASTPSYVSSVAFSSNGSTVASGAGNGTITLWDSATGRKLDTLARYDTKSPGALAAVAFSPNGTMLAAAGDDQMVTLWDVANKQETLLLRGHTGRIYSVAFAHDGKTLASGSADKTVTLWDATSGKDLHTITDDAEVLSVTFLPNSTGLAFADAGGAIKLWDLSSNQVRVLGRQDSPIYSIAVAANGQTLASGSADGAVQLWDVESGQGHVLGKQHGAVYSVVFAPDGKTLASGSEDKAVTLWDVANQKSLSSLQDSDRVYAVAFSPDGKTLASGSGDGKVTLRSQ